MNRYLAKGLTYDGDEINTEDHSSPENPVGFTIQIPTREGMREYIYLKVQETFALGQVGAVFQSIDNADVDAAAATTVKTLTATSDFTANEFNDGTFRTAHVTIDAGTGVGQTRAIRSNRGSASVLTLDRNWDVALDLTSDYVTYDTNYVQLCSTGDGVPFVRGVAIGAITAAGYGWFQRGGFCPLVRFVGSTDPAVAWEGIVPSSTAGAARGFTNGGTTADEVSQMFGVATTAYATGDSAGIGIAAILCCK